MNKHSGAGGSLRADALGTFDSVVMAVAGCGPAYTIAGTFPALIAAVGVAGPAVLLYCALPVLGIALAFRHLGRLDPNAGASYSWTGRSLHPFLGFLSGWALVVSATVFMASTALPAGAATLSLFGSGAPGHTALATAVGAGWFLLMAGVVMYGARISAHAQTAITGAQLVLLLAFAVTALSKDGNVADFSLSWFGFSHFDGQHHFVTGALIAVFAYWGWDVTGNLGEETRGGRRSSGFGGVIGVVTCFALFVVFTLSVNILVGTDVVRQNPESFLTVLGDAVWPGWGGRLLVLAVLLSTVATLETSLIQATRTLFSMGRDRTLPPVFGRIHPRRQTPWTATLVVAGVALAFTIAVNTGSGAGPGSGARLLADAVSGVGLLICFYYGLAAFSAVVVHRKQLFASAGNLLLIGLWPLCGGLFMVWIFVQSVTELNALALGIGLGTLVLGVVPMLRYRRRGRSYYEPVPLDPERARAVDASYGVTDSEPSSRGGSGRPEELLTDF
ncbi:APC family permease [Streptomyces sp. NPDC050448]|uniref:APC family permease n=1 Tax=Streptomyces sp. NPDC050448 TaxID=3155404 RepID=UPI00342BA063